MDAVTAYLYGDLDAKDVYMEIPEYLNDVLDIIESGNTMGLNSIHIIKMVQKYKINGNSSLLKKALYGPKQFALMWY